MTLLIPAPTHSQHSLARRDLPLGVRVWGRGCLLLVLSALLAGCASVTEPANERRVTEYGATGGLPAQFGGAIGGCRLVMAGQTDGCLRYVGTQCSYTSPQCAQPATPGGVLVPEAPDVEAALTGPQRFAPGKVPDGWISIPGTDGWWAPPGTPTGIEDTGLEPDL